MPGLIALLTLALVLAASHVEAECAWVLWAGDTSSYGKWITLQAYGSEAECKAAWTQYVEAGTERKMTTRFACLPDTIDPRGPRGK